MLDFVNSLTILIFFVIIFLYFRLHRMSIVTNLYSQVILPSVKRGLYYLFYFYQILVYNRIVKNKSMKYFDYLENHPDQVEDLKEAKRLSKSKNKLWYKKCFITRSA